MIWQQTVKQIQIKQSSSLKLYNKFATITKMLTVKIKFAQCWHLMCFYRHHYFSVIVNNGKSFLVWKKITVAHTSPNLSDELGN